MRSVPVLMGSSGAACPPGFAVSRIPLLIAVFCLIWSSAFAIAKCALQDCPPLLLLTVRFLLASLVMLGWAAVSGDHRRIGRRDILALAVLGIANNAVYLGLNYIGMRTVSAGLSALIVSANPVLTALLAAIFLNEPLTGRRVVGLLLGVAGVAFIVENRLNGGTENPFGVALVVGALVSFVGGTILFKRLSPGGGLWVGNGLQNLAGGLALAPFALSLESVGDVVPSWRLLAALVYLVALVSVLGYLSWFHLLNVCGATAASAYYFLMPPLGVLSGWLLLGERVELADLLGILPVALGIYLVTRPARAVGRSIGGETWLIGQHGRPSRPGSH